MAKAKSNTKKTTKKGNKSSTKSKDLVVDFSDTEGRGGAKGSKRPHFKEGDYLAKITKVVRGKSSQKKTPQVTVTFKIKSGPDKKASGKTVTDNWYLTDAALWRFRNLLEGAGLKIPSKKTKVDITKLVGQELGITLEDDEYETDDGKSRVSSRVTDTFLASELDEVEEDLDADLDDDEEEEEDDEDDEDDEDEDDEDDEDEDDDEDDDDEDEDEDDDDDLEELDVDDI